MKVLVTGATGYIGGSLIWRLLKDGHTVIALARRSSNAEALNKGSDGIRTCFYDGSLQSLTEAMRVGEPDVVCHLASLFLLQHKPDDVDRLIASNILFPTQLLEAMDAANVRCIVNVGTSWQSYAGDGYNPVNLYAATKQAFEDLLEYYVQARDFHAVTMRFFDTYGPGDTRPKLFTLLRRTACEGTTLKMSPGRQLLDLVYIDDVVDALVIALERVGNSEKGELFGVFSGRRIELKQLVQLYGEIVGRPISVEWGGLPYRPREVMAPWSGARAIPGWKATRALEDGIVAMERDPAVGGLLSPAP